MSNTAEIKLYRASAGAGKTYRLTMEFLKLLIKDPSSYQRILAVTFTNKATGEMQSRIIEKLHEVVSTHESVKDLQRELIAENVSLSEEDIVKNAQIALFNILHDYSNFRISTIDSFFQIILRNLARELGLGAYMNIVIDESEPLEDAVKLLIDKLNQDTELLRRFNEYSQFNFDNSKKWNVKEEITQFGKNIFKENYKLHEDKLSVKLNQKDYLSTYRSQLYALQTMLENQLFTAADGFDKLLSSNGFSVTDLSRGVKGPYSYIEGLKNKKLVPMEEKKYLMDAMVNPSKWTTKTHPQAGVIQQLAINYLNPEIIKIEALRAKNAPKIISCRLILKTLHQLGFLQDIANAVRLINESRNQFMLSDTAKLLCDMIDDSDAPFIYEKIGAYLEHIMIDEFQDTSETQWKNFKPLLLDCVSRAQSNLVVGDAKQSIYRFRNGDWRIIDGMPSDTDLGQYVSPEQMGDNWRSEGMIIEFNNLLFEGKKSLSPILKPYQSEFSDRKLFSRLASVYADAHQNVKKDVPDKGYVCLDFIQGESMNQLMLEHLAQTIKELHDKGVRTKDITILVRHGKDLTAIAAFLSDYKRIHPEEADIYNVISDEAFLLKSSKAVVMIIEALRVTINPEDTVSMMHLFLDYKTSQSELDASQVISETLSDVAYQKDADYQRLYQEIVGMKNLPLYELVESLAILLGIEKMKGQENFVFAFMDGVNEYIKRKSPDVAHFLDYWNRILCMKKIPFSAENGIRMMTIHKSKGLEFNTVIIPYCDWKIWDSRHKELMWCVPTVAPFNALPVVPIEYSDEVASSLFSEEYQEERLQRLVDTINLLYVAFTRAEKNMIILCGKEPSKSSKDTSISPKDCYELMNQVVEQESVQSSSSIAHLTKDSIDFLLPGGDSYSVDRFDAGTILAEISKEKKVCKSLSFDYHSTRQKAHFRQSNKSNEYIEGSLGIDSMGQTESIRQGNIRHLLFSLIHSSDDIPAAVDQLVFDGILTADERELEVRTMTELVNSHPEWFAPGLKLYNECSILFRNDKGQVKSKRPDRVIQVGNKMIIIDFKTGAASTEHIRQVKLYANLLHRMGYETEGYLWYLKENETQKVC